MGDRKSVTNIAKTKLEIEIEQHLLSTTIKLSDGTTGLVFSRGPKNESQMFLYNCHLCGVPNLPGERCLQTHIAGRKHQTKLSTPVIDAESFRAPLAHKSKVQMHIAPGEPVPPGFENEVKPIAKIQPILDRFKEQALVGLEYVMELICGAGKEPFYHCVLCNKRGDPRTIINHLTSYNHRIKFLEKHFPSVTRELEQFRYIREARNTIQRVVQRICEGIEDHHGRLTPNVHDSQDYNKNPMRFLQEAISDKHFDEKCGPNFVNIVDRDVINKSIKAETAMMNDPLKEVAQHPQPKELKMDVRHDRNSLDSVSSISSSSFSRSRSKSNSPVVMPPHQSRAHRSRSPRRIMTRVRSRSPRPRTRSRSPRRKISKFSPFTHRNRPSDLNNPESLANNKRREKEKQIPTKQRLLPTPKELSQQASEIANERYKWEKYRCLVEIAVEELGKIQKEYEKNPEKHPLYPEEWKKFWNKRYKELQAEKKDPAKHDFKPEWIDFWTRRMKEIYDEDIENKKQDIRNKLGLPNESEEKTDQLKEQYKIINKRSPPPSEDDDCILQEDDNRKLVPRRRLRSRSPASSHRKTRDQISPEIRMSRERRSRDRFSPIPERRHRSRSREIYPEREYYPVSHRHPPPAHYSETYEQWAARYYGQRPVRPVFTRTVEYKNEEEDNQPLTVISVLRLLTALEEHLGSLGPKVVDLLAKALALEKVKANSADDLLLNEDYCVIFETVKEKLKGQLIAQVIEQPKIHAVKKAIKNIAEIIHMINEKTKLKEEENENILADKILTPTPKPNEQDVNKAEIAKKIATSLIAQGKTDVTNEQLEELINAYIVMIKNSKESQKPLTTANYLKEIEQSSHDSLTLNPLENHPEKKLLTFSDELEKSVERNRDEVPDTGNALESLTDSDLQTLLQNFKDLSSEEQQHLITYLKKLESLDPERVEKLRKYVDIDASSSSGKFEKKTFDIFDTVSDNDTKDEKFEDNDDYDSDIPGVGSGPSKAIIKSSLNMGKFLEDPEDRKRFLDSDDDDDDYTFDDVVKAASKNVKEKQIQDITSLKVLKSNSPVAKIDDVSQTSSKSFSGSTHSLSGNNMSLSDTKNLIANLMGSLQKNVASRTPLAQQINTFSGISHTDTERNVSNIQPLRPYYLQSQPLQVPQNIPTTTNRLDYNNFDQYNVMQNQPKSSALQQNAVEYQNSTHQQNYNYMGYTAPQIELNAPMKQHHSQRSQKQQFSNKSNLRYLNNNQHTK